MEKLSGMKLRVDISPKLRTLSPLYLTSKACAASYIIFNLYSSAILAIASRSQGLPNT